MSTRFPLIPFLSAAALALLSPACVDTRPLGRDGGVRPPTQDAGGIVLMDSGPTTFRDSGIPIPRDSGTATARCTVSGYDPLPSSCLPRCAAATETAVRACADNTCATAALDRDTTPPAQITLPDGSTASWGCRDCWEFHLLVCYDRTCPAEFAAWIGCDRDLEDCTAQDTQLMDCLTVNEASFNACVDPLLGACFP